MQYPSFISRSAAGLVALWMSSLLPAQTQVGHLTGTIYDQAGARLDHAAVTVRNAESGAATLTHPSDRGDYRLESLPPGKYSVRVSANGLATVQINDVLVQANKTSTVNVTLPMAKSTPISVVEVSEVPEPIDNPPTPVAPTPPAPAPTTQAPTSPPLPPVETPETITKAALREVSGLRDRLALSADQQSKIRAIFEDRQAQIADIRIDASLPPPVRRDKIKAVRADAEAKFRAVLNENQTDEYEEILRERRERAQQKQEQIATVPR